MDLLNTSHKRYNALTGEWILVSPHRLQRPWQGKVEDLPPDTRPAYDTKCYLCPGNERAGGHRNPGYTGTFVFTNDFSALLPDAAPGSMDRDGLLVARSERGLCRVICFSPRHDLTMPDLSPADIRGVVDVWAAETAELAARPDIGYVQVFENKGAIMGCSNPHPHGQIWATETMPVEPDKEDRMQAAFLAGRGGDLLGAVLDAEIAAGERIVCRNDEWVALVPFWAKWPFETMVVPVRRFASLPQLDDAARDGLADVLRRLTARYDNLFRVSFPYTMGFHQAPADGADHPHWRLHAHFYPPLLRSATVQKFMVGFEMLATPQRDITAEGAAARLRELDETPLRATAKTQEKTAR